MRRWLLRLAVCGIALFGACEKASQALPPLALEELAGAFQQAFQGAPAEARRSADAVVERLKAKDFPTASLQLNALSAFQGLSAEQQSVVARARVTVGEQLQNQAQGVEQAAQDAAAKGTPPPPATPEQQQAAEALRQYRATK
jgi:uncharacterized coiled-coil protein SlyX